MVQIHSPRPLLLESIIYITRKCEERLVAGQEVELQIHQTRTFFPSSIQRVTPLSQLRVLLHLTDDTDKFRSFVWNVEDLARSAIKEAGLRNYFRVAADNP
jgi:positive regulator of sigma E activity